jgi:hypothetical protein
MKHLGIRESSGFADYFDPRARHSKSALVDPTTRRHRLFAALAASTLLTCGLGCDAATTSSTAPAPSASTAAPVALAKPAVAAGDRPRSIDLGPVEVEADRDVKSDADLAEPGGESEADEGANDEARPAGRRARRARGDRRRRGSSEPAEVSSPREARVAPDGPKASKGTRGDAEPRAIEADAPEKTATPLRLRRIAVAPKIGGREPVGAEDAFSRSEIDQLYAFVELANDGLAETDITVRFVPPSGSSTKVTLDVGPKARWRTWALRRGPRALGTWRVVVTDASGAKLGERSFEVTE